MSSKPDIRVRIFYIEGLSRCPEPQRNKLDFFDTPAGESRFECLLNQRPRPRSSGFMTSHLKSQLQGNPELREKCAHIGPVMAPGWLAHECFDGVNSCCFKCWVHA